MISDKPWIASAAHPQTKATTIVNSQGRVIAALVPNADDAEFICEARNRPVVVCLCGSTRFYTAFQEANYRETMAGNIVLSVGFYPHSSKQAHGETIGITPEQKEALDQLHLRKVAMADEVLILNCDQYIGPSTAGELAYARSLGKTIRFLEEPLCAV